MRAYFWQLLAAMCSIVLVWTPSASAQDTSDYSTLTQMSPRILPQVADALRQLGQWKSDYQSLKSTAAALGDLLANPPADDAGDDDRIAWSGKVNGLVQSTAALKQLAGPTLAQRIADAGGANATAADVQKIVAQEAARGAKAWALQWCGNIEKYLASQFPEMQALLDYANTLQGQAKALRDMAQDDKAQVDAVVQAAGTYQNQLAKALAALRDPSTYAAGFLDNEFKAQFLNKQTTAGGVTFTTTAPDPTRSIFSPDANIGVTMSYPQAGCSLKASGLYFRYRKGQVPEPVLDRIKVQPGGLDAFASSGLKALGDQLPDLGLPIQIKNPRFNDFSAANGKRQGSLEFTLVMGLDGLLDFAPDALPKIQAAVVLYANGQVDLGALKATIDAQVPIATSGLVLDGGWLLLQPRDPKNKFTVGTHIAPAAGGKQGIALDVQFSLGLPPAKGGVAYQGTLTLGNGAVALGKVQGTISRDKVTFQLDTVDQPASPYKIHCKGELNKQGLRGDGTLDYLYGLNKTKGSFYAGFDGYGSFTLSDQVTLSKVFRADASFQGQYAPGFKNLTLQGSLALELEIEPLGTVTADVTVVGNVTPQPRLHVTGSALGAPFAFDVGSFGEIYDELRRRLLNERSQIYQGMAKAEKAARDYAADRDRCLDDWIYQQAKKYKIDTIHLDNGPLDAALGRGTERAKALGKMAANWRDNAGQDLSALRQHTSDFVADPGAATGIRKPEDVPGAVAGWASHATGGLLLTDSHGTTPAPISIGKRGGEGGGFHLLGNAAELTNPFKDLHNQIDKLQQCLADTQRFKKILEALEKHQVVRSQQGLHGETGGLRVRFDRALIHRKNSSEVLLTFMVQSVGSSVTLDPTKKAAAPQRHSAGSCVGAIRISGLGGAGKPKIHVDLPRLTQSSPWDADSLVRDELIAVVEKILPGAQVDGRFHERAIAVQNHSDEPLMVWVQVEAKKGSAWQWTPGIGADKPALRYVIPAHKLLTLHGSDAQPLKGQRTRIWAESQSGRLWLGKAKSDVWLVDLDNGLREYYADRIQHFVYDFWAAKGAVQLHERIVEVANATGKPLLVQAAALSYSALGGEEWDRTPKAIKIEPGRSAKLWQANGFHLRGQAARFVAQDEQGNTYRWTLHQNNAITQVPKEGYRAESIGVYRITLGEPGSKAPGNLPATSTFVAADQVWVPSVQGKTLQEAKFLLTKVGVKAQYDASASGVAKVLDQVPPAGWHAVSQSVQLKLAVAEPLPPGGKLEPHFTGKGKFTYYIEFPSTREATVSVRGKGTTDVDLFIYDEKGSRVAADIGPTDQCDCRWQPAAKQTFKVVVENLGTKANACELTHNGTFKKVGPVENAPVVADPKPKAVTTNKTLTVDGGAKGSVALHLTEGRTVRVYVSGAGKTDVDLLVTGPGGFSVTRANVIDGGAMFTVRGTGMHTLQLHNRSKMGHTLQITVVESPPS